MAVYVFVTCFPILCETVNDFTLKLSFFSLRKENETRRRIAMKGVFARLYRLHFAGK